MKTRRRAREGVLQGLYQCDALGDWSTECLDLYFSIFQKEALASEDLAVKDNLQFARKLAEGVVACLKFIDTQISSASERWSISKMSLVDRNILRMATFEIFFLDEIPTNVTLNEAIEIAKRFGSADTPNFVNGVLDKIATTVALNPQLKDSDLPEEHKFYTGSF